MRSCHHTHTHRERPAETHTHTHLVYRTVRTVTTVEYFRPLFLQSGTTAADLLLSYIFGMLVNDTEPPTLEDTDPVYNWIFQTLSTERHKFRRTMAAEEEEEVLLTAYNEWQKWYILLCCMLSFVTSLTSQSTIKHIQNHEHLEDANTHSGKLIRRANSHARMQQLCEAHSRRHIGASNELQTRPRTFLPF